MHYYEMIPWVYLKPVGFFVGVSFTSSVSTGESTGDLGMPSRTYRVNVHHVIPYKIGIQSEFSFHVIKDYVLCKEYGTNERYISDGQARALHLYLQ